MTRGHWRGLAVLAAGCLLGTAGCGGGGGGGGSAQNVDVSPPSIFRVDVTRAAGSGAISVLAIVVDSGSGVASVNARASIAGGGEQTIPLQSALQPNNYTAALPSTAVRVKIVAVDVAGNTVTSEDSLVSPPPPPL
jgi:hypothetical protein